MEAVVPVFVGPVNQFGLVAQRRVNAFSAALFYQRGDLPERGIVPEPHLHCALYDFGNVVKTTRSRFFEETSPGRTEDVKTRVGAPFEQILRHLRMAVTGGKVDRLGVPVQRVYETRVFVQERLDRHQVSRHGGFEQCPGGLAVDPVGLVSPAVVITRPAVLGTQARADHEPGPACVEVQTAPEFTGEGHAYRAIGIPAGDFQCVFHGTESLLSAVSSIGSQP